MKKKKIWVGIISVMMTIILVEGTLLMNNIKGIIISMIFDEVSPTVMIGIELSLIGATVIALYTILYKMKKSEKKVLIIISTLVMNFGIISYLISDYHVSNSIQSSNIFDSMYQTIQLFVLEYTPIDKTLVDNSPISLYIARFLAIFVSAGTIILILAKEQFRNLMIKLTYKNHVVICCDALQDYMMNIAKNIEKKKVIVAYYDDEYKGSEQSKQKQKGIMLLKLDEEDDFIERLHIKKVSKIFLLRDKAVDNIILANKCFKVLKPKRERIRSIKKKIKIVNCYIKYSNQDEFQLYSKHSLFVNMNNNKDIKVKKKLNMRCVHLHQLVARNVIYKYSPIKLLEKQKLWSLNGLEGINIGIMGEGKLLDAMFYEAALNGHYNTKEKVAMTYYYMNNNKELKNTMFYKVDFNGKHNAKDKEEMIFCYTKHHQRLMKESYDQIIELNKINISSYNNEKNDSMSLKSNVIYLCYHDACICLKECNKLIHFLVNNQRKDYIQLVLIVDDYKIEYDILKKHIENIKDKLLDKHNIIIDIEAFHELAGGLEEIYDGKEAREIHGMYTGCFDNDTEWDSLSEMIKELNYSMVKHSKEVKVPIKEIFKNEGIEDIEMYDYYAHIEHNRWKAQKILQGYTVHYEKNDDLLFNERLKSYGNLNKIQIEGNKKYVKEAMGKLFEISK